MALLITGRPICLLNATLLAVGLVQCLPFLPVSTGPATYITVFFQPFDTDPVRETPLTSVERTPVSRC